MREIGLPAMVNLTRQTEIPYLVILYPPNESVLKDYLDFPIDLKVISKLITYFATVIKMCSTRYHK